MSLSDFSQQYALQGEACGAGNVLGHSATAGATSAPRLVASKLQSLPHDMHLVPKPRGAFSNLILASLAAAILKPNEVRSVGNHV